MEKNLNWIAEPTAEEKMKALKLKLAVGVVTALTVVVAPIVYNYASKPAPDVPAPVVEAPAPVIIKVDPDAAYRKTASEYLETQRRVVTVAMKLQAINDD